MERASEGSRFNQTGCGHSTASATAFVPNAESRQRPAIEQRCSRTKEPNEAIGGFFGFFLISLFKTHRHNFYQGKQCFTSLLSSHLASPAPYSSTYSIPSKLSATWHSHIFQTFTLTPLPSFSCCSDCSSLQT